MLLGIQFYKMKRLSYTLIRREPHPQNPLDTYETIGLGQQIPMIKLYRSK